MCAAACLGLLSGSPIGFLGTRLESIPFDVPVLLRYALSGFRLRSSRHVVVTGLLVCADEQHCCFDRSIRGAVIAKAFQNALTQSLLPHAPAGLLLGCLANGVCRVWFRPVTERPA